MAGDPLKPADPDRSRAVATVRKGCCPPAAQLSRPGDATSDGGASPAGGGVPGLRSAPVRPGSDRRQQRSPEPGPIRNSPLRTERLPAMALMPRSTGVRPTGEGLEVQRLGVEPLLRGQWLQEPAGQRWWGWRPAWHQGVWAQNWLQQPKRTPKRPPNQPPAAAAAPTVPRPAGSAPWPCCSGCGIRPRPAGRVAGRGPRGAPPGSGGTWGGHWRRSDGWARPREPAG